MLSLKKANRILEHLKTLSEMTGKPLRKEPREPDNPAKCPIVQFAPNYDKHRYPFSSAIGLSANYYKDENKISYPLFEQKDTYWWEHLNYQQQLRYFNWLKKKVKEI